MDATPPSVVAVHVVPEGDAMHVYFGLKTGSLDSPGDFVLVKYITHAGHTCKVSSLGF